jgi:methylphosphotriester-DNA--protein-cysteine methyltransferase
LVERFDRWVRERLDSTLTLDSIVKALGTSKRTLSRRLDAVLGKSPIEYIQDLSARSESKSRRGAGKVSFVSNKRHAWSVSQSPSSAGGAS